MGRNRIQWLLTTLCVVGLLAPSTDAQVTGVVRDSQTLAAIEGALVSLQNTDDEVETDANGFFDLPVNGTDLVIVAAKKTYYYGFVVVSTPTPGVEILLDPVVQENDPDYFFPDPNFCGFCHPEQFEGWDISRMRLTGLNTWVYDLYNGSGTPGGMNGFVYVNDTVHPNPNSTCASCHQPLRWVQNPGVALGDIENPDFDMLTGVGCETCHKIQDVDDALVNEQGLFPGVTYIRPDPMSGRQVQFGILGDVDFEVLGTMQPSYQPGLPTETCAVCHQYNTDPDDDGDFEEPGSLPGQQTYTEWQASPYGDPQSPLYSTCSDCHMRLVVDADIPGQVCTVISPPLIRPEEHSMLIEGSTPDFLENAVTMDVNKQVNGNTLEVEVALTNVGAGHKVPAGVVIRNMILLVEAYGDGGSPLAHTGSQIIDELGGVGDPAEGNYAGLAGKFYGKIYTDAQGNRGVLFTEAVSQEVYKIDPLATDVTQYAFEIPPGTTETFVRARMIYRRAYRPLVLVKGWTLDGLGYPLADIAPPHYGFLMEEYNELPPVPEFVRGDCNADGSVNIADAIFGLDVLFGGTGPAPCDDACDSNDDFQFDVADVVYTLNFLFVPGSPAPPTPFPDCGGDPPGGSLGCDAFAPCP